MDDSQFCGRTSLIGGVGGWGNLDAHANETIVWTCRAFSILSADLVLQWQQLGPSPSVVRRHSPASPADAESSVGPYGSVCLQFRRGVPKSQGSSKWIVGNLEALRSIELDR